MAASTAAKNQAIEAVVVDRLSLHDGNPGAAGTANEVSGGSYARQACTFAASATNGERALSSPVEFDGPSEQEVTHIGFWENSGTVFKFAQELGAGSDGAFNVAGEYIVTTDTKIVAGDLAD